MCKFFYILLLCFATVVFSSDLTVSDRSQPLPYIEGTDSVGIMAALYFGAMLNRTTDLHPFIYQPLHNMSQLMYRLYSVVFQYYFLKLLQTRPVPVEMLIMLGVCVAIPYSAIWSLVGNADFVQVGLAFFVEWMATVAVGRLVPTGDATRWVLLLAKLFFAAFLASLWQ